MSLIWLQTQNCRGRVASGFLLISMQTWLGRGKPDICCDTQKRGKDTFAVVGNQNDTTDNNEVDMLLLLQVRLMSLVSYCIKTNRLPVLLYILRNTFLVFNTAFCCSLQLKLGIVTFLAL